MGGAAEDNIWYFHVLASQISFLGRRRFVFGMPHGPPLRAAIALLSMHHTGGLAGI
jgi:hypothetical protein